MIYLAPLQGFTDFVYRKTYSEVFNGIDKFFIPYISVKNDQIIKKYIKEILPENNSQTIVIPQVLAKNSNEIIYMAEVLKHYNYKEINLNLGCPYPMVTNRGKGSGLLPHPEKIKAILSDFFEISDLKLSVKIRAGLLSEKEIEPIINVLNKFPLTEIIVHPRIATQLYKGKILGSAFQFVLGNSRNNVVYNGDIFSISDYQKIKQTFPNTKNWMLGRGILKNPFLPAEINEINFSTDEKCEKLEKFHRLIFETYLEILDNPGNALNKMKQFWIYFSFNFSDPRKVFKQIKKLKDIRSYQTETNTIFAKLH